MDIVSYILSRAYVKKSLVGVGALKGAPCTIASIVDNLDGTHNITFSWKDNTDVTHTSVLTVKDGETPAFSSVAITGGHRLTFTTQDPVQSVSFNVMDGEKGDTGISVVASNVDENNNLTLTLSNGNVINAGKIKAVTSVDNTLSTTSSNPVENKAITNALNNKVDKEMGKGLFSDEEKTKLANIEDGAQVNVLEKLIVNGQEATITDKSIALTLITSAVSNLQNYYLKTETYTKQEVEDLIGQTVGVTIEIVEQLPAVGQTNVIYFVPTSTEGVYSQYIYTANDGWVLIGSTNVDLSNYYNKTQVDTLLSGKQNVLTIDSFPTALSNNPVASGGVYTAIAQMQPQFQFASMPTASSSNLGFVYQYTGATGTYTQNMFYRCVYDSELGEYKWEEVIFHATVTVDSALSGTSTNPVQNKVVKEALDTKQDIMQYSTMPSAQDNLGKIVQYIGTNTANYTNGYFYKAIYDSVNDVYLWTVIKFSADMLVDNALSTTSENPVQNKVITGAINGIQDVIPSEASSANQLVDRDSLGTASQKNFTPYVSPDNTDVPIASSVYSAITSAVYGAYHPSGSKTIAELTSDLLVFANIGNVYKITEDGVTTNLFIGGAGQTIHTGDNAVVVYGGQPNTFLFDLQSGSIDLTPYQTKTLTSAVEGETTVEGALGALSDNKQAKTLTTSVESQTTVESALGALSTNKATQAEVNDMNNVLGAKNLLPSIKASKTVGDVTFTLNDDGSITANGTASSTIYVDLVTSQSFLGQGNYVLSGGVNANQFIYVNTLNSGTYVNTIARAEGEDAVFPINYSGYNQLTVGISITSGQSVDHVTFYPMIRLASDPDNTYVPYAPTNAKLNEEKVSWKDNGILGAKNFIPTNNMLKSESKQNLVWTPLADGAVRVNGTASALSVYDIINTEWYYPFKPKAGSYILSCDGLEEDVTYVAISIMHNDNTTDYNVAWVSGTKGIPKLTLTDADIADIKNFYLGVAVYDGQTVNNAILKPMLRLATDSDDTYQPYAMTNQQLTVDKLSYADNGVLGAKNLLTYPYTDTTKTVNGITFTDNADGTITVSGTATANVAFALQMCPDFGNKLPLILSGCPTGGAYNSGYRLQYSNYTDMTDLVVDTGEGAVITKQINYSTYPSARISIEVRNGTVFSTPITFKPMLRLATDSDDTYQPYAMTNRELTDSLSYSTTETKTGGTWIDGKPIYRKVIRLQNPVITWTQTSLGVDVSSIVSFNYYGIRDTGDKISGYYNDTTDNFRLHILTRGNGNALYYFCMSSMPLTDLYVILEYTKP